MSLHDLKDRAQAHQERIDTRTTFLTPAALAKRWGCSEGSVRAISRTALPYLNIGTGLVRERRRYNPDDVYAYESGQRLPKAG